MMRSTLACGALVALVLGPARAAAQGTFEGMVTYKLSTPDGETAVMRYYQLGGRTRHEFEMKGVTAVSIMDGATGDMITLMPQQKQYMVMNLRQMGEAMEGLAQSMPGQKQTAPDFSKVEVTRTGQRETLAGTSCEHYVFTSTEADRHSQMDMCGATGMGFFGVGQQSGSMMPSTAALLSAGNPDLAQLARTGFFPLKLTVTDSPSGKTTVMEATAVDRRRPDAALFAPPAGYTKLTLPTMPSGKP